MLSKEKITKNAKKFNDTGVKYGFINDTLLEKLGIEFFSAPACSTTNLYGTYDGGLVNFILTLTKHAISINGLLPENKKVDEASLIKVCFLHQIGKAKMFTEQKSQWHKDNRGELYIFNEDLIAMSVAERSIYYLMESGISLTEDETFAIFNYNSDFSGRPLTRDGEKLASILKVAIMTAIIEIK